VAILDEMLQKDGFVKTGVLKALLLMMDGGKVHGVKMDHLIPGIPGIPGTRGIMALMIASLTVILIGPELETTTDTSVAILDEMLQKDGFVKTGVLKALLLMMDGGKVHGVKMDHLIPGIPGTRGIPGIPGTRGILALMIDNVSCLWILKTAQMIDNVIWKRVPLENISKQLQVSIRGILFVRIVAILKHVSTMNESTMQRFKIFLQTTYYSSKD